MYLPCQSSATVEKLNGRGQSLLSCSMSEQGKTAFHLLLFSSVCLFQLAFEQGRDHGAGSNTVVQLPQITWFPCAV